MLTSKMLLLCRSGGSLATGRISDALERLKGDWPLGKPGGARLVWPVHGLELALQIKTQIVWRLLQ